VPFQAVRGGFLTAGIGRHLHLGEIIERDRAVTSPPDKVVRHATKRRQGWQAVVETQFTAQAAHRGRPFRLRLQQPSDAPI
jgi:hypothetical protein